MSLMNSLEMTEAGSPNLREGVLTPKHIKNAGRSEEVVENKGPRDIMPEKKSDSVSEISKIPQNFARFWCNLPNFRPQYAGLCKFTLILFTLVAAQATPPGDNG